MIHKTYRNGQDLASVLEVWQSREGDSTQNNTLYCDKCLIKHVP